MKVQCSFHGTMPSLSVRQFVEERLAAGLRGLQSRVAGAEVRLTDVNGPKGGTAHRCGIDLSMLPSGTLHVSGQGENAYAAARDAIDRLKRALARKIEQGQRGRAIRHQRESLPLSLPETPEIELA